MSSLRFVFLLIFIFSFSCSTFAQIGGYFYDSIAEANTDTIPKADSVYIKVDRMPEFPGGKAELNKFLSENLKFPVVSAEYGLRASIFVEFVVDVDGFVKDVTVLSDNFTRSFLLEEITIIGFCSKLMNGTQYSYPVGLEDAKSRMKKECIRVVRLLPRWKPGELYGKPVTVSLVVPILFRLYE